MNLRKMICYFCIGVMVVACERNSSDLNVESLEDQYIVVFKKKNVAELALKSGPYVNRSQVIKKMALNIGGKKQVHSLRVFSAALEGAVFRMTRVQARQLLNHPDVAYVEPDHFVSINAVQTSPTWGLDRIDQVSLPLTQSYDYVSTGSGVNAYVIDTGILISHSDFNGRAYHGADLVDQDSDSTDCNGHGTHVAGTIGGLTYGVAKDVKLYGVRVLDCSGSGRYSDVIAGVEWVTSNHVKPAVANMSLGGPTSQALEDAISASIAAGVTYVVAAGNSNTLACNSSPARLASTITVGSTTNDDVRSSFSNYGSCVDVFAPGSQIKSSWYTSSTATNTISGTSMASPHVAGVAALYLSQFSDARPGEVKNALLAGGVNEILIDIQPGSPNLLINSLFINKPQEEEPVEEIELIENNVVIGDLSSDSGEERLFKINVPEGSSKLVVDIYEGTGDADLYLNYGEVPTTLKYECRPFKNGNTESCSIDFPTSGSWYIMVKAYSVYSDLKLVGHIEALQVEDSPCDQCDRYVGELTGKGSYQYHPEGTYYYSETANHQIWLEGPDTADFDLHFYKWQDGKWTEVARSTKMRSDESIHYSGSSGYYLIKVISFNGSGKYNLWRKL